MKSPKSLMSSPLARLFSPRGIAAGIAAIVASGAAIAFVVQDRPIEDGKNPPTRTASMTVNVLSPAPTIFSRAIAATGTVNARDELIIGSDAAGVRLMEVLVDVGSVVEKGQLLALGDDRELRTQLAQQLALIKQAKAELLQAEANVDRAERLKDSGVYSFEALQTRETTAAAARAKLELAQAQRAELEVRIAHTRVVSPAAGIIAKKAATVGAVVQPGTELFRLIKDGQLEWRAEMPSHSITKVETGAKARVLLDDGAVINAQVRMVAPTIDASTRNGLVHVTLPKGAPLKVGGHVKGEILIGDVQALAVPESSVLSRDGYPFVYVVDASETVHLVKIETGARQQGMVEISKGLGPDSRVVGTGAGFVKDGDLVRVSPVINSRIALAGGKL